MSSKKFREQQLLELKQTLIPELLPEKFASLGINPPQDQNNLLWYLAHNDNFQFLDAIVARFPKIYNAGINKEIEHSGEIMPTEAALSEENLEIAKQQLKTIFDDHNINACVMSDAVATIFLAGYYAGAHDYKVNTEKFTNDGVVARVVTPRKGGVRKAEQAAPVKELCLFIDKKLSVAYFGMIWPSISV